MARVDGSLTDVTNTAVALLTVALLAVTLLAVTLVTGRDNIEGRNKSWTHRAACGSKAEGGIRYAKVSAITALPSRHVTDP